MRKELSNMWVNSERGGGGELRLDWFGDRHHAIRILNGDSRDAVVAKLKELAVTLENDKHFDT